MGNKYPNKHRAEGEVFIRVFIPINQTAKGLFYLYQPNIYPHSPSKSRP